MSGLSRNDFFRMLLPGAAVVFLIDIATRVLAAVPAVHSATLDSFRNELEEPFIALATAFGVGLLLYFIDPGYGAPQFYKNIPSAHLRELLAQRGLQRTDALSVYLVASDSMLPDRLQDRALFYGAVYRIGFQIILYTFLTAALIPLGVLFLLPPDPEIDLDLRPPVWLGGLLVLAVAAWPWLRELLRRTASTKREPTRVGKRFAVGTTALVLLPIGAWAHLAARDDQEWAAEATAIVSLAVVALWIALRLIGPLKQRLDFITGERKDKPDIPHNSLQIALLDLAVLSPAVSGVVALSGTIPDGSVWSVYALCIVGMIIAILGKHERQQQGIYRNQNAWLDSHIEEIIKEFGLHGNQGGVAAETKGCATDEGPGVD